MKIGEVCTTKNCGKCKVIKYVNSSEILVRFLQTKTEVWCGAGNLRKGTVKDPYCPSVYGVGFIGVGSYKATEGRVKVREYAIWNSMLQRCYDPKFQARNPTYIDAVVCKEWHNFQNFAAWYNNQPHAHFEGYQLDKDLRVPGNKVYSPKTCALVPQEVNSLLTGHEAKRGKWPIGVHLHKRIGRFAAQINVGSGNNKHIGYFDTPEEAHDAYRAAKTRLVRSMVKEYKNVLDPRIYKALRKYEESRSR